MSRPQELTCAPLRSEPLPVELMNTIWADRDGIHDALSTPAETQQWLTALGADPPARLRTESAGQLRDLRDALRSLAAATTRDPRPAATATTMGRDEAVRILNSASARAHTWPELAWPKAGAAKVDVRSAPSQADVSISLIAQQAVTLFGGPEAEQVRACLAPGCVLYFLKSHPRREWCSAACGNRARVARHYQRHRDGS